MLNNNQSSDKMQRFSFSGLSSLANTMNIRIKTQMVQLGQAAVATDEIVVSVDDVTKSAIQASDSALEVNQTSSHSINTIGDMNSDMQTLAVNIQLISEINIVAKGNASDVDATEKESGRLGEMADNLTAIVS
ncbi:hypothetical protein [Aliivibrio finisterrensis]|uniref:Methyl-accepting chemotaxis protein n=1 Tax=Aliivibrio finisterrensis TaxID=511998 RepID=A0A6N6RRF6_9GAMM|nr:hypothetical protein [Aliivibrio finisterrensis]KAB2824023.1 hypothetical protein F8B77_12490 [Aliivibrio finisterrensis]